MKKMSRFTGLIGKLMRGLLISVLGVLVLFFLFEGFSSTVYFIKSLHRPIAERVHTQYDEQLGWVNIPNKFVKDMYGPGIYLRTNSQGFRSGRDFPVSVPKDKVRIVCSGDSFTLGWGVDNDHTWCQGLTAIDGRLETVNMGQGGYGIDQAYLWYLRDGAQLEHQVHIFAMIRFDVDRAGYERFMVYGKPLLKLENGNIVVHNTPVPRRSFMVPWLMENLDAIQRLNSIQLIAGGLRRLHLTRPSSPRGYDIGATRELMLRIFEDLFQVNKRNNRVFVVVYLPTLSDLSDDNQSDALREYLRLNLSSRQINFIDLVDDLKGLTYAQIRRFYISNRTSPFPPNWGHYTSQGNEYIAGVLYRKLAAIREVAEILGKTP
jgi:hypothetical protein